MLTERTVGRLRLATALEAELQEPSSLLPSRSIEAALRDNLESAAAFIAARIADGARSTSTEVVVAAKSSRGFRPVHALDIEQRVLYRALVDLLAPGIDYPDRSDEAYEQFKRAPLSADSATHIVRADVASFYQYVDHRLLESEVVSQTGEAQVAASVLSLVGSVMGRAFGLPQNTGASHSLADVYIDMVERQLLRHGQSVWRYNDDFAMATKGLKQARNSLEELERSLRLVGLTPNDEKSMVLGREAYQAWVDRPAELKTQISDGLAVDLDAWILEPASGYDEESDEEEGDAEAAALAAEREAQVAGAVRTLGEWLEHIRSGGSSDPLERYVYRSLARDAIRVLRRRLSPEGLAYCDSLLAFEPQMTHTVCRYLSRIASTDAGASAFVAELVARPDTYLSVWQKLWLLEPLLWSYQVPTGLWNWVTPMLDDRGSSLLRARAALVLATHGQISTTQIGLLFDESTAGAKPDLVVAMVRASGGNRALVGALADENQLLRLVAAHAAIGGP
jgi:RNA-directed DNA polymerase